MVTSLKRACATCCVIQVCCTQRPCPCGRPLLTWTSAGDSQTLRGRSGSVSVGPWWAQGFVWGLWVSLVGTWFDSKLDFAPPTILLGLLLCPWMWSIFFGGIQHSPVDGCSAACCNFGVLTGEDERTSFYSTILSRPCPWKPHHRSELFFCEFVWVFLKYNWPSTLI